jgi:DNA-directed RNA polymerase subunit RPC12/RpoP
MTASTARARAGSKRSLNLWCSRCETAFRGELGTWLAALPIACPHCGARHLLPWKQLRMFRPEYPARPEYGHTYPLSRVSYR